MKSEFNSIQMKLEDQLSNEREKVGRIEKEINRKKCEIQPLEE